MLTKKVKSIISLKDWENDQNLRKVTWQRKFLCQTLHEYDLQPGEAAVFVNKKQDRVRLVVNVHGFPVLVILPIDKDAKRSMELEVALFLKSLNAAKNAAFSPKELLAKCDELEHHWK